MLIFWSLQVGADGCIFVWKLPAFLSSRILQRTKGVPKLQTGSANQPMPSNQIKPELEVEHQNNGCNKEAPVNSNINKLCGDMPSQDGSSTEIAGFRLSISQLPKWARYQVTKNSLPASIDSISSKVQQLIVENVTLENSSSCCSNNCILVFRKAISWILKIN